MKNKFSWLVGAVTLAAIGQASAGAICQAKGPLNGKAVVIREGMTDRFYTFINAGRTERAIRCCVACIVSQGSEIMITDMGFASHTVEVLDGSSRGCVGVMPTEHVEC